VSRPPLLFTPGPLTTRLDPRRAMLTDWGSREPDFIGLTAELRRRLLAVACGEASHVAIPLQGSGTFIVEAAVGSLVGPDGLLLVLANGAYGVRMAEIARRTGRRVEVLRWPEHQPVEPAAVDRALAENPAITHVGVIHCETTTGLLNPLAEISAVVARRGRALIVDAMSSFGALPIDLRATPITALLASSNKCLESVPGIAFALVEKSALERAAGVAPSLCLDLHDQWRGFEANGQWRFTPPVQVAAALVEALRQLEAEGGPPARYRRYAANFRILAEGMERLGFRLFLDPAVQAPIIATFHVPDDRRFRFDRFYALLAERGFVIYPGKLTQTESFRIGCIGDLGPDAFTGLLEAVGEVMAELGVVHAPPAGSVRRAAQGD